MRSVIDIGDEFLVGDLLAVALTEVNHLNQKGLWPMALPAMGAFIFKLCDEGYPYDACQPQATAYVRQKYKSELFELANKPQ